jgi:hypothetical protein
MLAKRWSLGEIVLPEKDVATLVYDVSDCWCRSVQINP